MRGVILTALVLAVVLWVPLSSEAQQPTKVYRVGVLSPTFSGFTVEPLGWLGELGYVQGKNIVFERRSAGGRDERLPELAAELVGLKVDVILVAGIPAARAAKQVSKTVPIVMVVDGDPVKAGLVSSLARPGGNMTGVTTLTAELNGKRLQLLKETIPGLKRVAIL